MQYFRKIESSVSKLAYPSGVAQSLGTLALDSIAKITDVTGIGYNDNTIFQVGDENPARWELKHGTYTSKTTLRNGKPFGKMVAVQKRFSQDGTIFPPSKNAYLGTCFVNRYMAQKSLQHKLNIIRNATTYSPVQELAVFQGIVTPKRLDMTAELGIRIDPTIATDDGVNAVYLYPKMEDTAPYNPHIVGSNDFFAKGIDTAGKKLLYLMKKGPDNIVLTEEWVGVVNSSIGGFGVIANFKDDSRPYFYRMSRTFIVVDLYDYDKWKSTLAFIVINTNADFNGSPTAEGGYKLPISAEMIAAMGRAKAKGYAKLAFSLVTMTGQLYDAGTTTNAIGKQQYIENVMYRNDIVPDSLDIDPNGDWIKFRLVRPGKYTAWFNNQVYAFEKMSTDGLVTLNKTTEKFTAGGKLEIKLFNHSDTSYYETVEVDIPDLMAPNPPTIVSYAKDAVYGTADSGDKVVIERDGVIIGQGVATSTNTYEVAIAAADLDNGQIVYAYTKDTAGNASAKVQGTVVDIISNLKYDIADTTNALRVGP